MTHMCIGSTSRFVELAQNIVDLIHPFLKSLVIHSMRMGDLQRNSFAAVAPMNKLPVTLRS
jgi:hypothetical protein